MRKSLIWLFPIYPWEVQLAFYFRLIFFIIGGLLLGSSSVTAINLHGLYLSSCERVVGVILRVEQGRLHILSLEGVIRTSPRNELNRLAYYPVLSVPISKFESIEQVYQLQIITSEAGQSGLITGWPINFSENNISLLSKEGHEIVINRSRIRKVELISSTDTITFESKQKINYNFVFPAMVKYCGGASAGKGGTRIYPDQVLSDISVIQQELTRMQRGYEKIVNYATKQKFYAVPQVFSNDISIGYWGTLNSRYGESKSRKNIGIPKI